MSADEVDTMTLLSSSDATTLYGTGHPAGAIEVRTRIDNRPRGGRHQVRRSGPAKVDREQWDSGHRTRLVAP